MSFFKIVQLIENVSNLSSTLMNLDLGDNQIGTEGAISLAAALPNCPLLSYLSVLHRSMYGAVFNFGIDDIIQDQLPSSPAASK